MNLLRRTCMSMALPAIALTALLPTVASAQNRPFPQHTTYTSGTIKPNNASQSSMDSAVITKWNAYKSRYVKSASSSQMYVEFESNGDTVSEAHGYGMLMAVLMAGADSS